MHSSPFTETTGKFVLFRLYFVKTSIHKPPNIYFKENNSRIQCEWHTTMMKKNCKISKQFIYFTGRTRTCLIMVDYVIEELHLQNVQFWNVCTATFSVTTQSRVICESSQLECVGEKDNKYNFSCCEPSELVKRFHLLRTCNLCNGSYL